MGEVILDMRMPKLQFLTFIFVSLFLLGGCRSGKTSNIDFPDGSYQGEVDKNGKKQGKGLYKWHDGSSYEGDFDNDLRHGNGFFRWANGETYKGDYLKDARTGHGIYKWPDGSSYDGSYLNGKRHGKGIYVSSDRNVYEGNWFDDLQHGEGTLTRSDGSVIQGLWRNGQLLTTPSPLPPNAKKPKSGWGRAESSSTPPDSVKQSRGWGKKPSSASSVAEPFRYSEASKNSQTTVAIQPKPTEQTPSVDSVVETISETETAVAPPSKESNSATKPKTSTTPTLAGGVSDQVIWEGNKEEAEMHFATYLVNGIDTIFEKKTQFPFSGKMRVLNASGSVLGEFGVLNGRMHGEEIYFDGNGKVTERKVWVHGQEGR